MHDNKVSNYTEVDKSFESMSAKENDFNKMKLWQEDFSKDNEVRL